MAKTRANGSTKISQTPNGPDCHPKSDSKADGIYSSQVLVLPKDTSEDARIISLKNPRCSQTSRYLICPANGIFEFKDITGHKNSRRSWFINPNVTGKQMEDKVNEVDGYSEPMGHTIQDGDLLIATIIDPLFIILPLLIPLPESKSSESLKKLFLPKEEYLKRLTGHSPQISCFLETSSIRELLSNRIAAICDMLDVDGEELYRLNEDKLVEELIGKARSMASVGLPRSIEESIIRRSLEIPNNGIKCDKDHESVHRGDEVNVGPLSGVELSHKDGSLSSNNLDAESSKVSTERSRTPVKSMAREHVKQEVISEEKKENLLRIKISLLYIFSNYIAPHICEILKAQILKSKTLIDFGPLDVHLEYVSRLRQDALSARSSSDFSRKRPRLDDGDTNLRVQKKSKDGSKKSNSDCSRGVKVLKKANISGMKKMSEFFKKS